MSHMSQTFAPYEVPLLEQLRRVPADARVEYEHSPTCHEYIPAGSLCLRAADEIADLRDLRLAEALDSICTTVIEVEKIRRRG